VPDIAKTLLSLSAAFMCTAVGVLAIVATRDMEAARTQAAGVVTKLNLELDEAHRLTLEAGLTAMEARKASAKESKYLDQWNKQIAGTFDRSNELLSSLRRTSDRTAESERQITLAATQTLQATTETVKAAQATIEDLGEDAQQLQNLEIGANEIIADPKILEAIGSFAMMGDNFAVISTDLREVVHGYVHPSKKKLGFWGTVYAGATVVHKFSPPLFDVKSGNIHLAGTMSTSH
jgi:hypothetical protein